ncbi:MAG: hypothetical protein Q4F34_00885 [Prevotellaceae bacterium]|nr:hypothetical protein [Prevotellaceae bacterium]
MFKDTDGGGSNMLSSLNKLLVDADAMEMSVTEGKENVRYLCDDGRKSFSLALGTKTSNAGTKSQNYRMRLVKHVVIEDSPTPYQEPSTTAPSSLRLHIKLRPQHNINETKGLPI